MATKKVTVEIEIPQEYGSSEDVERLVELLRKGAPLDVKPRHLRRTRIYANRSRY